MIEIWIACLNQFAHYLLRMSIHWMPILTPINPKSCAILSYKSRIYPPKNSLVRLINHWIFIIIRSVQFGQHYIWICLLFIHTRWRFMCDVNIRWKACSKEFRGSSSFASYSIFERVLWLKKQSLLAGKAFPLIKGLWAHFVQHKEVFGQIFRLVFLIINRRGWT